MYYIDRLRNEFHRFWFRQVLEKIFVTPPVEFDRDPSVTIVSMVSHSSVAMYLLAIKSFLSNFRYGSVEVIDDGTLLKGDYEIIANHIPGVAFSRASEVDTFGCPNYVSWRRLFRIVELAKSSYVVQLDSDTLTLAPLIDVRAKVRANQGFVIGSERWGHPVDPEFMGRIARHWLSGGPQVAAERVLAELPFFSDGTGYLRGCAGFAGYPKGFASSDQAQSLSSQIEQLVGPVWRDWGSEQCATLCLISKTPDASILPWPVYRNYKFPETAETTASAVLIHFIGTTRFSSACYGSLARSAIKEFLTGN